MPAKIRFTQLEIQSMALRYEAGESFRAIAQGVPCAKNTVRAALLLAGVVPDVGRSIGSSMKGKKSALGRKWSDESRARASAARAGHAGTRFGPHSAETLAKISAGTKGKNVKHTPEKRAQVERLRQACKRFLYRSLRASGLSKRAPSAKALGYSPVELWAHLGPRPSGAHVDHYVPIAEFTRRGLMDVRVINALPNLRWLDGVENQRKSASPPHDSDAMVARCVEFAYTRGLA